ncbi:MAG: UDP-N-acetylmuramoyl-tripeptide--D-alanyl-D-alanine ligase [Thermodesulfobacteriota bacterium]|nr:UDP-N-acetylmuramoyl-tripeptide--D-alanyl-D-alanine ligase [Thermodesulfobacteriota bacterium]
MRLSSEEIRDITRGEIISTGSSVFFDGISTDSRNISAGELFIALDGDNFNAHRFVSQALAGGASGAIVMERVRAPEQATIIRVRDTLCALGDIAGYVRKKINPKVVGITGSTGKTTVKELCYSILRLEGECLKTQKNYNNLIGLPLSLLRLQPGHRFAVIEMGTSRIGEIDRLSAIACPDISVLTNINPVHLNGLGSMEGIIREKQAIFQNTSKNGIAVINPDQGYMDRIEIPNHLDVITCSAASNADITLIDADTRGLEGTFLKIDLAGRQIETCLHLPGMHNVTNALLACGVAHALDIDPEQTALGLSRARSPEMRSEIIISENMTIINDSYNASPASMKAGLDMLVNAPQPVKIAVLGDMLELGDESNLWHEKLGMQVAASGIDKLIITGRMANIVAAAAINNGMNSASVHISPSIEQMKPLLVEITHRDAIILVKASRGLHLDEVVTYLKAVA